MSRRGWTSPMSRMLRRAPTSQRLEVSHVSLSSTPSPAWTRCSPCSPAPPPLLHGVGQNGHLGQLMREEDDGSVACGSRVATHPRSRPGRNGAGLLRLPSKAAPRASLTWGQGQRWPHHVCIQGWTTLSVAGLLVHHYASSSGSKWKGMRATLFLLCPTVGT